MYRHKFSRSLVRLSKFSLIHFKNAPKYITRVRSDVLISLMRFCAQVGRVFATGPGDLRSIPGRVIPKTLKMVLGASLLNTQQYKVRNKGKVEPSRERSSALPYISV